MNLSARLLLAGLLLGLSADTSDAGNWPRFRGPNGTGIATDTDIPTKWSDKENLRWKVELPGIGHSSPVVWGNRLFVQSSEANGKERWFFCIDTKTGKTQWKKTFPGGRARTHRLNTLASCSPATDGERVYIVIWDGRNITMNAFDFEGKLVWKRDFGEFTSMHGPGHSPMIYEGILYFANDQQGSSTFMALDAKNGQTIWKTPRTAFNACYSTPTVYTPENGKPQIIVGSSAGLTAYEPKAGKPIWNYKWTHVGQTLRTVASPHVCDGHVFHGGGNGAGRRHFLAVKLGGSGDITKSALSWQATKATPYVPCLLSKGKYIYGIDDNRQRPKVVCYEAATGKQVWLRELKSVVWASPVMIGDNIYIVGADGEVTIIKAAPKFEIVAKNDLGEGISATPAVADGALFLRGDKHLFCISKKE